MNTMNDMNTVNGSNSANTKRCSKCGERKPTTEFTKRTIAKDGLCCHCRLCAKKEIKKMRDKNRQKNIVADTGFKVCCHCKKRKKITEFAIARENRDGRKYECKECFRAESRKRTKEYYKKVKNTEKFKQLQKSLNKKYAADGRHYQYDTKLRREDVAAWNEKVRKKGVQKRDELQDCYIRGVLVQQGKENITQEMIEEKRNFIKAKRLIKQIKKYEKENHKH